MRAWLGNVVVEGGGIRGEILGVSERLDMFREVARVPTTLNDGALERSLRRLTGLR